MRILLILLAVLISVNTFAQKAAIQTAYNYIKYEDFDKAKEAIDGACLSESTMSNPKAWYYRGLVYEGIFTSKNVKFDPLKPGSLIEAYKSFGKASELDAKKEYSDEIKSHLEFIASTLLNQGVDKFVAKDYTQALVNFEATLELETKYFNRTDTAAIYNAALSSDKMGNMASAKKYYNELIKLNYGGAKTYDLLTGIYLTEKDTANALLTLNAARQKYPDDNGLIIKGLNIYLASGRDKEAFEQIDAAIAKDPKNANLYFAKGTIADKLGKNPEAMTAYKSAIEQKPDFFDAYYNLGAMYFNEAAELANKANNIPNSKIAEYEKAKKLFEDKFKEAQPYLEKAHQLNPADMPTMSSLRQLYARIGDLKKATDIKTEMDGKK